MQLSTGLIKAMGYSEHPSEDILSVRFGVLRAYSLQGLVFDSSCEIMKSNKFTFGHNCTVAISQSINDCSLLLTGEKFTDDEKAWCLEKKARPPFILLYFKESSEHILKGGFRQKEKDYILVHDAFPNGKTEIKQWEKIDLPSIVTALTVCLSSPDGYLKLVPVDKSIFGKTGDGLTVFDLKITGKMEGYTSIPKRIDAINLSLQDSVNLFSNLDVKISRHIYMALGESDRLKQFIYFFLFVERYTHSQYKLLHYEVEAKELINIPSRLQESATLFFKERHNDAKNLTQRFCWCAILKWNHLNDEDIDCFKEVRNIRNKISHGEDIDEASLPIEKIRKLSLKLLDK